MSVIRKDDKCFADRNIRGYISKYLGIQSSINVYIVIICIIGSKANYCRRLCDCRSVTLFFLSEMHC